MGKLSTKLSTDPKLKTLLVYFLSFSSSLSASKQSKYEWAVSKKKWVS